jgi:hypothetical protein
MAVRFPSIAVTIRCSGRPGHISKYGILLVTNTRSHRFVCSSVRPAEPPAKSSQNLKVPIPSRPCPIECNNDCNSSLTKTGLNCRIMATSSASPSIDTGPRTDAPVNGFGRALEITSRLATSGWGLLAAYFGAVAAAGDGSTVAG